MSVPWGGFQTKKHRKRKGVSMHLYRKDTSRKKALSLSINWFVCKRFWISEQQPSQPPFSLFDRNKTQKFPGFKKTNWLGLASPLHVLGGKSFYKFFSVNENR
jgi:hypothetical protein